MTTNVTKVGDTNVAPDGTPDRWTKKMVQALKAAMAARSTNAKPITLNDLAADSSTNDKKLSSPRSIEACLHLGTDPSEIIKKPIEAFARKGLPKELVKVKYERHENLRKGKLHKLLEERERIIEQEKEKEREKEYASTVLNVPDQSTNASEQPKSLEKERQRLQNLRRRQQKELEQMAKYEAMREQIINENQARLEAQKIAEELKKQERARKEKDWQTEQRKRELAKIKEEEAIDKRSKQLAAERYLREQEHLALEQQKQRKAHREAVRKEQERMQKQQEFKKQMERAQEAQQEILRKKQQEMEKKDLERQKLLMEQHKEKVRQNMEARKQAEARLAVAVENFRQLMQKRTEEYQKRQQELKIKLKQQEERHKQAEIEKKKKEAIKEQQRLEIVKEAEIERQKRIQELLQKSEAADMMLQNIIMQRQLANARRILERQLEFEEKHVRVESIQRIKALQRYQLLQRIQGEGDRVRRLIEGKQAEQERHRAANIKLSIHRQAMLQKMEKLSITKKWKDSLTETDMADLEAHERKRNDHKSQRGTLSTMTDNL